MCDGGQQMSKARRSGKAAPLSPAIRLSALRPRLDKLFGEPWFASGEQTEREQALETLLHGLKPENVLPVLLSALVALPKHEQPGVSAALLPWLHARGYAPPLRELAARFTLSDEQQALALSWLGELGADTSQLARAEWDPFLGAYFVGNESQSTVTIFGYTSPRNHRSEGLGFLIDFEPPWDGAVKDAVRYPQRAPDTSIEQFSALWRGQGMPPEPIEAAEAKQRVLTALQQNCARQIRLHRDLIAMRDLFARLVLTLPDSPETPAFTLDDFDALARSGREPEAIQIEERMLGYQTRMPDGGVIRLLRPDDDELL
jgi:hypothetical protein